MIRGDVITAFRIGKLFGSSFIITGAMPWPKSRVCSWYDFQVKVQIRPSNKIN